MKKVFYHGSSTSNLKKLIPQIRFTPTGGEYKGLVYLTPNKGYACCHAFPWSSDEGFDLDMNDETRELTFKIPEEHAHRLKIPIYIYEVEGSEYKEMKGSVFTNLDYVSDKEVQIVDATKYSSVKEGLEENGVSIII